jgi:hypothetical protein
MESFERRSEQDLVSAWDRIVEKLAISFPLLFVGHPAPNFDWNVKATGAELLCQLDIFRVMAKDNDAHSGTFTGFDQACLLRTNPVQI